jgi:hypothetical protein
MSAEEVQSTPPKTAAPSIIIKNSPRTYNQVNVPRKYTAGRRRFTIYWTWSYPWEANRDVAELDNRFSTMTEVRRVGWPRYETSEWSEREFLQGIAGTLELFHLSTVRFQNIVGEATGHPVVVYQRIDQAGQRLPVDDQVLGDTDTMMIFGLDHMVTEQEASAEEIPMGPTPSQGPRNPWDCAADGHEGFGCARMAYRRHNLQLPSAPAALCSNGRRCEANSRPGTATHRHVAPASVHGSRKSRIQFIPLDAAKQVARWRYFAG